MNEEKVRSIKAKLRQEVKKRDWSKERKDAYVYGTLRKLGWTPKT